MRASPPAASSVADTRPPRPRDYERNRAGFAASRARCVSKHRLTPRPAARPAGGSWGRNPSSGSPARVARPSPLEHPFRPSPQPPRDQPAAERFLKQRAQRHLQRRARQMVEEHPRPNASPQPSKLSRTSRSSARTPQPVAPLGAKRRIGFHARHPGDVEMDPRAVVLDETLQELRRGDRRPRRARPRSSCPRSGFSACRHRPAQGHPPRALTLGLGGLEEGIAQRVVVGEDARVLVAQRDDDRPRQRWQGRSFPAGLKRSCAYHITSASTKRPSARY